MAQDHEEIWRAIRKQESMADLGIIAGAMRIDDDDQGLAAADQEPETVELSREQEKEQEMSPRMKKRMNM